MTYEEYKLHRRKYQEDGALLLLERKHACLFYEAGKGKTYPTIDALQELMIDKPNLKLLILSTADACKNMWNTEIVPQHILPKDTTIMSFTKAIQDSTKEELLRKKFDVMIIDESHKIKSNTASISKLVYRLSKNIEYVWGLTGTPRGNSDVDIFCQFHNMRVDQWGDINYTYFIDNCCDVDLTFTKAGMINKPTGINSKYRAGWEKNIARNSIRVDYENGQDEEGEQMPTLNVKPVYFPFTPSKEYNQAMDGVIKIGDYASTITKLVAITKLHQIANGYIYIPDDNGKNKIMYINDNAKLKWLENNVYTGKPVTIVYRFEADYIDLSRQLNELCIAYTDDINTFKSGKASVLLLQCSRCESFNLQMCSTLIFYTLDYSYIKYNQMLHRVWRTGQTEQVDIMVLLYQDSVEEQIWNAVQSKETLAKLFMRIKGD